MRQSMSPRGVTPVRRHRLYMRAAASKSAVGARPGKDLHDHRFGHRQRSALDDQIGQTPIYSATGGSVVLDPRGGVGEDHVAGVGATSDGVSPMAFAPRMAKASSRVIGCPARWRKAKSTASVFVRTP